MFGFDNRRMVGSGIGLAVGTLLVTGALTGCGAGQVSQVATQEPAVNGTLGSVGDIALRNVHLQAAAGDDALKPGSDVSLIFTAINDSLTTGDKLVDITTDIGEVALSGDTALPVGHALAVSAADSGSASEEQAKAADATVTLSEPIHNGLTYDFTFTFEQAGKKTLAVPISAGETPAKHAH